MTVTEAQAKIEEQLNELAAPLREKGLNAITRIIYTDKNLAELPEFGPKAILVFGDLAIGTDELERDDYCNYSLCCEIKTGMVDDTGLDAEIKELISDVDGFYRELEECECSASELIKSINKKQEEDAEKAAGEFSKEMNKLRWKLIFGIGIIAAIILAVIVGIPLLT